MAMFGTFALTVAFAAALVGVACCTVACVQACRGTHGNSVMPWAGRVGAVLAFVALLVCCAVLVVCFVSGDNTIAYVVQYRSNSESPLAWLYILSGLWAGRQGSLLFWAMLIAAFATFVTVRHRAEVLPVDNAALAVMQAVVVAFLGVLLFSADNMPFRALDPMYLAADGSLTNGAELWSLNALLEHWAMAIHPPTLFIGYAGLTVPFAYALGALLVGDDSDTWVLRVNGVTAFSWLFLGIGIGLGAVWAYVVLGWGGYWGWDPVENASLLSWLVTVALMHSFTLYRTRAQFKRWSVVCACLAFMFVIVGTFISRSGLVQSVHAFDGDPVSLALFGGMIAIALAAAIAGVFLRPRSFAPRGEEAGEEGRFLSREMAYYLNNVIMVLASFLLAYLTISSALPSWMPFGGATVSATTYDAIARPVGVFVVLMMALCPLLTWKGQGAARLVREAKVPLIVAAVAFVLLMAYFVLVLVPAYDAVLALGGSAAAERLADGPTPYYFALTIVGFAAAALLFSTALWTLVREVRAATANASWRRRASAIGGFVAHCSMAVILVGLIGSSMYTVEHTGYVASANAGEEATEADAEFSVLDYTLVPQGETRITQSGDAAVFTQELAVYRGDEVVQTVMPSIEVDVTTMQQKLEAQVISFPDHDLFVVFQGLSSEGDVALDVRVNPLISLVWVGFALLMVGTAVAMLSRREGRRHG